MLKKLYSMYHFTIKNNSKKLKISFSINKKVFLVFVFFYIFILFFNNSSFAADISIFSSNIKLLNYSIAHSKQDIHSGDTVYSYIEFKNIDNKRITYWVGFSILNPSGFWFDKKAKKITLSPESSGKIEHTFVFSDDAISGEYKFVLAVWDSKPGDTSVRLLDIRKNKYFSNIRNSQQYFIFDDIKFQKANHSLGRGRFINDNVILNDTQIILVSQENSFNGAEFRTINKFGYGIYQAKIKTDSAPGSFTAFFLYQDIDCDNDEIDIEIYNDGSGRIDLVTWVNGVKTNYKQKILEVNPTLDFYTYKIKYLPEKIAFFFEDSLLAEFTKNIPNSKMKIMFNHWFPSWLESSYVLDESRIHIKEILFNEY